MKIAVLCHTGAGGSGIMATEMAVALSESGHDVHIIGEQAPFRLNSLQQPARCTDLGPLYRDLGDQPPTRSFWGEIVRLAKESLRGRFKLTNGGDPNNKKLHFHEFLTNDYPLFGGVPHTTLRSANTLAAVIEKHQIEIVHAHYAIPHATAAILVRDSGLPIKVVTTLHGTDVTIVGKDPSYRYTTRHALEKSDAVTAVSQSLITEAQSHLGISRPIVHIPNWVDSKRFIRSGNEKLRAQYAQPEEAIFLHLSNFRPVKRSPNTIRIFARICEKIPARLLLVGEGPEKAQCIELAVQLNVSGRVLSLPSMSEVEKVLGISDFLLLPSESEAFPLAALEAMAAGAVVIASSVGGVPDMIEHGKTGYLFQSDDIDGMAAGAVECFRERDKMSVIQSTAQSHVMQRYNPETILQSYLAVYRDVLREPHSTRNA